VRHVTNTGKPRACVKAAAIGLVFRWLCDVAIGVYPKSRGSGRHAGLAFVGSAEPVAGDTLFGTGPSAGSDQGRIGLDDGEGLGRSAGKPGGGDIVTQGNLAACTGCWT
jgi:hypothetical protein